MKQKFLINYSCCHRQVFSNGDLLLTPVTSQRRRHALHYHIPQVDTTAASPLRPSPAHGHIADR